MSDTGSPPADADRSWVALTAAAQSLSDALLANPCWGVMQAEAAQMTGATAEADLAGYRSLPGAVEAWLTGAQVRQARARRWALSLGLAASLHHRLQLSAFPTSMWDGWRDVAWRALERVQRHPCTATVGDADQQFNDGASDWPSDWEDPWRKDLALLSLRAVPCVSHIVVPGAGVPRTWVLRGLGRHPLQAWRLLVRSRGRLAPYLENHVHPWMLSRFSPEGRDACLRQVAQLLRLSPKVCGLMGTSWYYDDALAVISPKLAYLRQGPQAHGAVFLAHAPSDQAALDAALRSPARRQAIEQGAYVPRAVTMLWPRDRLLASPWGQ